MSELTDYAVEGSVYQATPEAVAYITAHQLEGGILEIIGKMRELIPALGGVRMDVLDDPTCDCEPELRLLALFPADMDEATVEAALDAFDRDWWLDNSHRWDYRIEVHPASL